MRPTLYPQINDITMVVPTKITDLGIYVKLIEYNNIEGLIMLSDLSKSRIRSINKVVKIGKNFAASVQNLDEIKKNISLSKKVVSEEEAKMCENNFRTLKYIENLVTLFVTKLEKDYNIIVSVQTAYETFIWSLSHNVEFLIFALKSACRDFDKVYSNILLGIDPLWIECYKQVLAIKFKNKEVLLETILEITCFETGGVNIIKSALLEASQLANEEFPFKIKLVKSPYYSITIKTTNQEAAIIFINEIILTIKTNLDKNNANMKIHKFPEIVIDKEFKPEDSDTEESDYDSQSEL